MPFAHIGRSVDLPVTDNGIEAFAGDQRLSSHLLAVPGKTNTYRTRGAVRRRPLPGVGPPRVRECAGRVGENTLTVVDRMFEFCAGR